MGNGRNDLVVGLDIGTTKICAVVGQCNPNGSVDIVGVGSHPSFGLRRGVVVNIENTVASIQNAIEEAESMAGIEISSVYAGIAGAHIDSFNSHGVIAIKNKEVSREDIERVIDASRAVAISTDREILHVIPQEFIVDDQDGIKDPLGMSGTRLEVKTHIISGAVTSAQNIVKSCNRADTDVADVVLEQIASARAVLSQDEKELGVAMIDIGGGTTDLAIFVGGALKHTFVLPLGGDHLTGDIAAGLRTPSSAAEKIKRDHGCCFSPMVSPDETMEIPSVGGREPRPGRRTDLVEILEARVEEIMFLIKREIDKSGYTELLSSGMVLTGGSSLLEGMVELGERIFDMPVRRGAPCNVSGISDFVSSPIYATGVGLVQCGAASRRDGRTGFKKRGRNGGGFGKVLSKMKTWFLKTMY